MASVYVGTALLVRFVDLCCAVGFCKGFFLIEHPEDRGCQPYPSIWDTALIKELLAEFGGTAVSFDQGMLGAPSRKGTTLGGFVGNGTQALNRGLGRFKGLRAPKGMKFETMIGMTEDGQFKTSALQLYPLKLNALIV